ncbi:MAG: protein kinase [Ardenticatenaceae bacterium]|nr:protein kinase [Ardenticatenaceae bacterium]
MADTLEGVVLDGKYKILKRLGQGGMAEVYLAHQENLERNVAIKLMHAFLVTEQDFLLRFKREARAMAAMSHPNIVAIYDFDVYGENTYYLVMEYVSGGSLKDKLTDLAQKGERMPLAQAVKLARQVAEALDYAHSRQMIHRDVKPANIMLNDRGDAILTDFGIVKLVGGQSMAYTATGALIGTPAYMSPEQALGKPGDGRSDIYSLGVLLFQMVTGQLPFDADTPLAIVLKHVNNPVPIPGTLNPDIPTGLQEIILRAMTKEPETRYQTAGEMAEALRHVDLTAPSGSFAIEGMTTATGLPLTTAIANPATETAPQLSIGTAAGTTQAPLTATETAAPPAPMPKKRPFWLFALLGIIAIAAVAGLLMSGILTGRDERDGEPTAVSNVAAATVTQTPSPISTSTTQSTGTAVPADTPDVVASAVAAIELTEQARPTGTATPSRTPTITPSPTPNRTVEFLSTCTDGVELVVAYTFQNTRFTAAPVETTFTANWTLKNSGSCPWPDDLQWSYVEGNKFGYEGDPIPVERALLTDEEITLKATFVAPNTVGTYESTWQLTDAAGNIFGTPITFSFSTYLPATATPTATNTPAVTATPTVVLSELNYAFDIFSCEYVGSDWRCTVRITPYGGAGGPYTILILDQPSGQATEFRGPWPVTYFAQARRCAAFNTEIRVIDDGSATDFSRHLYIDPDNQFEGGCTLP